MAGGPQSCRIYTIVMSETAVRHHCRFHPSLLRSYQPFFIKGHVGLRRSGLPRSLFFRMLYYLIPPQRFGLDRLVAVGAEGMGEGSLGREEGNTLVYISRFRNVTIIFFFFNTVTLD